MHDTCFGCLAECVQSPSRGASVSLGSDARSCTAAGGWLRLPCPGWPQLAIWPCHAVLPPPLTRCPSRPAAQTSRPATALCHYHSPRCAVGRLLLLLRCPYRSAVMSLLLILCRDVVVPSLHARGLAPSSTARTITLPFMAQQPHRQCRSMVCVCVVRSSDVQLV